MLIFHVAERPRWEAAKLAGSYAWSTLGRTLDDEGFLHASRAEQVAGVLHRFYADHDGELVLLTIDTARLSAPWREERVGSDTYPHIFGPLNPAAVIEERPLPPQSGPRVAPQPSELSRPPTAPAASGERPKTFLQLWLAEFLFRICAAVFVMAIAAGCALLVAGLVDERWGLIGLVAGAAAALAVVIPINRRRKLAG